MRIIEKKHKDKETGKLLFVAWLTVFSYDYTGEGDIMNDWDEIAKDDNGPTARDHTKTGV